jgi:hypothetical protein
MVFNMNFTDLRTYRFSWCGKLVNGSNGGLPFSAEFAG